MCKSRYNNANFFSYLYSHSELSPCETGKFSRKIVEKFRRRGKPPHRKPSHADHFYTMKCADWGIPSADQIPHGVFGPHIHIISIISHVRGPNTPLISL
jgi:hypothetical protein